MATFSKASFNTVKYAAARPSYPKQLFDLIFRYHDHGRGALEDTTTALGPSDAIGGVRGKWERVVDLGCGTGVGHVQTHTWTLLKDSQTILQVKQL